MECKIACYNSFQVLLLVFMVDLYFSYNHPFFVCNEGDQFAEDPRQSAGRLRLRRLRNSFWQEDRGQSVHAFCPFRTRSGPDTSWHIERSHLWIHYPGSLSNLKPPPSLVCQGKTPAFLRLKNIYPPWKYGMYLFSFAKGHIFSHLSYPPDAGIMKLPILQ